jgi:AMP-binding enzyme C-terminal domain
MATRPISDLQKRRCGSFIAPGLRTTISPRSRTGSTQAGRLSHRLSACRALSPPQPAVRLARYEDLRHLLKHKRRYAPDALTAAERRILARKTFTRAWMATGKRLYYATTRGLNLMDQEGRGTRFVHQAPAIAARLRAHPLVRDVAVVAFPDRRAGTGLYAFVEANAKEPELLDFLGDAKPEHLQVVEALPRNGNGRIRSEILELVAMNQLDLIDPLIRTESERAVVSRIVSEWRNLRDRFAF